MSRRVLFRQVVLRASFPAVLIASLVLLTQSGCPAIPAGSGTTGGTTDNTGGTAGTGGTVGTGGTDSNPTVVGRAVVLGYNDLGMHCMNQDFSELMLLPPYNNLHAQVIDRSGEEPRILTSNVVVRYRVNNNTHSSDKTDFWTYAQSLLGVSLEPDVGLTGNSLSGTMQPTGDNDWAATGIPVTPIDDFGHENPYPIATITVESGGTVIAQTNAVVPVSWEISCDLCHNAPGTTTATDILRAHDRLHQTDLERGKPVLCAGCHADVALGQAGRPGVSNLSHAMHAAHAPRMAAANLAVDCYACHPGVRTQCLRDVHYARGMTCANCHNSMTAVASIGRRPWVDEPRCGSCHVRSGFEFEQPATLYRNSKGHSNVHCEACHGSPHAITPTITAEDNIQAIGLQGHAGTIDTCSVCHAHVPDESFFHRSGEGD